MSTFKLEIKRLQFLIQRDGYRATHEFALRALRMYRAMVLDEKSYVTHRALVEAYLVLKDFYFRTHPNPDNIHSSRIE